MKNRVYIKAYASEIGPSVPEFIHVLPMGIVKPKGHPQFEVTEAILELIVAAWKADTVAMVVDWEHQTLSGGEAPAAGWVTLLEIRPDGLWAKVDWTPRAVSQISNREYRYLSPTLYFIEDAPVALHSIALTNDPAIRVLTPFFFKQEVEDMKLLEELKAALGLAADATEQVVLDAVKGLKTTSEGAGKMAESFEAMKTNRAELAGVLGLKADAEPQEVLRACRELKRPEAFVPAAEHQALKAELAKRDAAEAVVEALKAGKVTPAQREWADRYAASDLEGFKAFVASAPAVVPMGGRTPTGNGNSTEQLSEVDRQVRAQLGLPVDGSK